MPQGAKITVLIVDDSGLARSMLRSIFEEDGGFEVVGEAGNGRQAVEMSTQLRPDLVTMDLEMPDMGGLDAIEEIMCTKARPILVVSGIADAQKAYEAVSRGAIEVVAKPNMTSASELEDLLDKARLVSRIPVITHPRTRLVPPLPAQAPQHAPAVPAPLPPPAEAGGLLAIASSTGGPQALAIMLAALPADLACPVVIAQHIADGFAPGMADWLHTLSTLPVRMAEDGQPLQPGTIYISPSEANLTVTGSLRACLESRTLGQVYRPSCDTLLKSVAAAAGRRSVGVILTGMGSDGVAGMEAIHKAGGTTLGQDEASSVIFGMNAIAIERGWVRRVLPLAELAPAAAAAIAGTPAEAGP